MRYFEEDKKHKKSVGDNTHFSELAEICLEELMLSSDAYTCMIKLNMHGYKRLHRCLSKKFHDFYLQIQNDSLERTGKSIQTYGSFDVYTVKNLKEHLEKWNDKIEEHLKRVGEIIKDIFEEYGYINCTAQEVQKCLFKNLIKNERALHKFEDCNWDYDTIYRHDRYLHKKMKEEEKDYMY